MSRYSFNPQFKINIDGMKKMFAEAIVLCDYPNICEMHDEEDGLLAEYSLMNDYNDNICNIRLAIEDEHFYLFVVNTYYAYYAKIVDINAWLLAYFIRNATKLIDDYDDSIAFFKHFFDENDIYVSNPALFQLVIKAAIEDGADLTYVDQSIYGKMKAKNKA